MVADQRVLKFISDKWCTLRLATAGDQHLAINQTTGAFASFRETAPAKNGWFQFLVLPRNVGRNQFWLFSRQAQGGSGELVADVSGLGLHQWKFEGDDAQAFEVTPLDSYDSDRKVRLTLVADSRVVSTRWDAQAFLWDLVEGDNQQWLHLGAGGAIPLPAVPEVEATPGNHDVESLKVTGFDRKDREDVVDATPPRVVGTQLVPFPYVSDSYSFGRQMRETPYYLLTRRCYWKKVEAKEYPPAGINTETLEWEIGLKQTESTTLERSVSIRIGAEMSFAPAKGKAGEISFARESGQRWTRKTEVERYEKIKGTHSVAYEDGQRVLVVVWALVSRYSLTRANGDLLDEVEFIENEKVVRDHHERVPTTAPGPKPRRMT